MDISYEKINPSIKKQLRRNDFGSLVQIRAQIASCYSEGPNIEDWIRGILAKKIAEKFNLEYEEKTKRGSSFLWYEISTVITEDVDNLVTAVREYDTLRYSEQIKKSVEKFQRVGEKGIERIVQASKED